jgi:hypothetical protein
MSENREKISENIAESVLRLNRSELKILGESMASFNSVSSAMLKSTWLSSNFSRLLQEECERMASFNQAYNDAMAKAYESLALNSIPIAMDGVYKSISEFNRLTTVAMDGIHESMASFDQAYTDSIIQSNRVSFSIFEALNSLQESMASLETISLINHIDIETLSSQLSPILTTLEGASIFEPYESLYDRVQIGHPQIIERLNEYQWFLLPEMPLSIAFEVYNLSSMDKPRQRINKLFFDYFAFDNFKNLKDLVNKWNSDGKFRPGRLKVINDSLNVIINAENNKIPSTLIVPALIAQIDGIQREFLLKNNFKISWNNFRFEGKGEPLNQKQAFKSIYSPDDAFSSIINEIILDVLFGNVYPGKPLKTPITFNRHKIMHGEHLTGGTKPNTIRLFIILDFLHDLL